MLFENTGLFHISEKILKNVDVNTQLNCRLVRKSWNNKFEKLAAKIDLKKYSDQLSTTALVRRNATKNLENSCFILN